MMPLTTVRSSKWKAVALGLLVLVIGLVIWDGADRRAADATWPLSQGAATRSFHPVPPTLKIGSFNIHSGKGSDGVRNLVRIANLLSDEDFVGLYEVRANSDGKPNQAAALGSLQDADWLFAPTESQWWSEHFGNGLIHRIPVRSVLRLPLINTRGKAYRNAILSTVLLDGTDVRVIAVHIDREADRRQQLQSMIDLFLNLKEPCVLMGDLNTTADDPLLTGLRDQPGVHSPLHESLEEGPPSQSIDWIFTRGLKTVSATLVETTASDHPYLKAEFVPLDSTEQ
jgi:endonuclease/exonuclease/phosphatase family metal-dependent hydrolase